MRKLRAAQHPYAANAAEAERLGQAARDQKVFGVEKCRLRPVCVETLEIQLIERWRAIENRVQHPIRRANQKQSCQKERGNSADFQQHKNALRAASRANAKAVNNRQQND